MNFTRIFELIYFQNQRFPSANSFNQKILGRWESRSTSQFVQQVEKLAFGLMAMGLDRGNKIGIFTSYGSTDWFVIDVASMMTGVTTIPINTNYTDEELRFIIEDSKMDFCFVNEDFLADKIHNAGFPKEKLISFGNSIRHLSWNDVEKRGKDLHHGELLKRKKSIEPNNLATIIYTSGSTGMPKGVMLSHSNIVSNIKSIISLLPVNYKHKVASYLPLSHIFERMVIYTYITLGAKIFFIQNPKDLLKNLQDIKPHYISSVPRVLEKIHNEINLRIKKKNKLVQSLVKLAMNLGENEAKSFFQKLKNKVTFRFVDLLVYRRWRNILGGNLKGVIVGAASMPSHIARLYSTAGIVIKEGYGLTETSPVVSFNRFEPGGTRFGSVGIPIPGVQVKINKRDGNNIGEILVKGPNVMLGYFNKPELTKERIDENGWFKTGDIGYLDGRFLYISDRKKNIIKTSAGQYIFLQKIEEKLRSSDIIDQSMVIGFKRSYLSALVIPDFKQLKKWCLDKGIHWTAELYMIENDRVKLYFKEVIAEINESLKPHEKIRSYHLLSQEWSVESEEYTPTLKFRRKFILEKYKKQIDEMYS